MALQAMEAGRLRRREDDMESVRSRRQRRDDSDDSDGDDATGALGRLLARIPWNAAHAHRPRGEEVVEAIVPLLSDLGVAAVLRLARLLLACDEQGRVAAAALGLRDMAPPPDAALGGAGRRTGGCAPPRRSPVNWPSG